VFYVKTKLLFSDVIKRHSTAEDGWEATEINGLHSSELKTILDNQKVTPAAKGSLLSFLQSL